MISELQNMIFMLPDLSGLRARRKALGISQQQLASDAGISQSLLAKVEGGQCSTELQHCQDHRFEDRPDGKARSWRSGSMGVYSAQGGFREAGHRLCSAGRD